jgi:hypothetical protein
VGSPRGDRCVLRVCDDRGANAFFWCQASQVIISGVAPYSQRLISDCVGRGRGWQSYPDESILPSGHLNITNGSHRAHTNPRA